LYLFCEFGKTALAEGAGGQINLLARVTPSTDQFTSRFQRVKENLPAGSYRIERGERNFSWPEALFILRWQLRYPP
jgi:hypothetical protein